MQRKIKNVYFALWVAVFILALFVLSFSPAAAATLSLSPSSGTFTVGSTFDVGVFLNSEGKAVNAVSVNLQFPPDKLQLTSPVSGRSIVSLWASPPRFDNQRGTVILEGLIPGGINTANGLVTTLTFRVRAPGPVLIKFLDDSAVLLHDGAGTPALRFIQNGIYDLTLPPPAGPVVVSQTHPDQLRWYSDPNVSLSWAAQDNQDIRGYSYVLDNEPTTTPDDILEGVRANVVYGNLPDGVYYFHIKASRDGALGGATHFRINIDKTPPARFSTEVVPSARTTRTRPVIQFLTSDTLSGINRYELKIIPLTPASDQSALSAGEQPFFIEAQSPFVAPELPPGEYDVIVRAYDIAGNYRETVQRLSIVKVALRFISEQGIELRSQMIIPWRWVWSGIGLILVPLAMAAWLVRRWRRRVEVKLTQKQLPPRLQANLDELKKYFARYGKTIVLCLSLALSSWWGLAAPSARAADNSQLAPPLITTVSKAISNAEIFYVGGRSNIIKGQVIIYLQNMITGEIRSQRVVADNRGEWFYIHDSFLSGGRYLLWVQSQLGDEFSPPSPQVELTVQPTALRFGASRFSREFIYLLFALFLLALVIGLAIYTVNQTLGGRGKHKKLLKEVQEAEESVRRGFAVLRRDLSTELGFIKKARLNRELAAEEKAAEAQLLQDLQLIERHIGKEIWDIERAEIGQ